MMMDSMTLTVGFLGVGAAIRTPYRNVGTLLDGTVLVDAPPDAVHALGLLGAAPEVLAAVLVTHLHGDHFLGLGLLLTEFLAVPRERPLLIAGPLGIETATRSLLRLAWPDVPEEKILAAASAQFVEWIPWSEVQAGAWRVAPIPVAHGSLPAYGLRLEREGHRVFHTGDSAMAPTVLDEVATATLIIADITSIHPRGISHMSLEDLATLRTAAPATPVMAIHRDFARESDKLTLFPLDGQVFRQAPGELPTLCG